ncbi:hypothetical protein K438DRAFT_1982111 [Mycena galopus ATCC 62051]|nr:hypothetical protein K438DRAFT_1982111 [Mycena galopus ATCC 62051]
MEFVSGTQLKRPALSLHTSASARCGSHTPYDPAGLSVVIRLKVRVVVLEERSEIGAHLLSGAVIKLSALDVLLPEWRTAYPDHPLVQPATRSGMRLLTQEYWILFLHPPQMNNNRDKMDVEVYLGFSGALAPDADTEDAQREEGAQCDEATHDACSRASARRGRGSSWAWRSAVARYDLNGKKAQTYGIGGERGVAHRGAEATQTPSAGRSPRTPTVAAGSTVYHIADGLVSISLVVGLDFKNLYIELCHGFQVRVASSFILFLFSASPASPSPSLHLSFFITPAARNTIPFRVLLPARTCLTYGARALAEGGL